MISIMFFALFSDVLVALLTVEAQSYGPCNLPGILATECTAEVQNLVQNQTMGPPSARPAPSVNVRPSLPPLCAASHVLGTPNSQSPLAPGEFSLFLCFLFFCRLK